MQGACLSGSNSVAFFALRTLSVLLQAILARLGVGRREAKGVVGLLSLIALEHVSDLLLACALLPGFACQVLLLLCET